MGTGTDLGVIDSAGRTLAGDQLLMLVAEDVLKRRPGATVIADIKASSALFELIAALGGAAGDVEDRAQPHQIQNAGDWGAARRR